MRRIIESMYDQVKTMLGYEGGGMKAIEEIKKAVAREIYEDARYILQDGLSGIPDPRAAFDFGKVDYYIDDLDVRLQKITENIVNLAIVALLPKLNRLVEIRVREKLRKLI